jgi:malto-oligosyltrehalose synthase
VSSTTQQRLGSTYRLQLNGFGFAAATELVPWLHELGVETLYLSPISAAMPGSTHGYDVVDPTAVDPELGGVAGLDALLGALAAHDMQVLIDIVPNHVAASPVNSYFAHLLRHGRRSAYASWFDVNWDLADGRIVLPVLDGSIQESIDRGRVRVGREPSTGRFGFQVFDTFYPVADPSTDVDDQTLLAEVAGIDPSGDRAAAREVELLVSHQHYRLVDWRRANQLVNYRRFFAINELIGIRQEDPEVFAATHALVATLAADERVAGFRVVDGMRDPGGYLKQLRALVDATGRRPVIEVEKILARDEVLPDWPVDGTTGYETAAAITGVLIDLDGARSIAAEQAAASGDTRSFAERAVERKQYAETSMFSGSVEGVTRQLAALGVAADIGTLRTAVESLTAHLEVYRTYRQDGLPMRSADVGRVREAALAARVELEAPAQQAIDKIVAVLTGPLGSTGAGLAAVGAWQQVTPAVVAKGVEDTALFDAGALLAACEVGVDPDAASWSVEEWHSTMSRRQRDMPLAMTAGSTHDSKRSVDVRSRLAVLSELGPRWSDAVAALERSCADSKVGPAARRYLYQTVVGAWPVDAADDTSAGGDFVERVREHVVKAAREAAVATTWNSPDESYETAYQELAAEVIAGSGRDVIEPLAELVALPGAVNSLTAVVLAATAPGAPDVYQGDDMWAFALTDPDNRRPVDWPLHQAMLEADPKDLLADWTSGRIKQHVLRQCLRLRRELGVWWDRASYQPLEVSGPAAKHVVAFARSGADRSVVTVVPRLPLTLAGAGAFPLGAVWADTVVGLPPAGSWREVLTGRPVGTDAGSVRVADLLDVLPVGVLASGA